MKQNNHSVKVIKTDVVEVKEGYNRLPPHKGLFNEYKVADYFCPEEWSNDGIFIEVKEGQPLWFDFRDNEECACLMSIQRLNPVTGEPVDIEKGLLKDPIQNYLKLPEQMWIDGYAKDGKVYQFMVTAAGKGLAVNEYVLPQHLQDSHAVAFAFYDPKNPKPKTHIHNTHEYHFNKYLHPSPYMPIWYSTTSSSGHEFNGMSFNQPSNSKKSNNVLRGINHLSCNIEPQNINEQQTPNEQHVTSNFFMEDSNIREEIKQASMGMGGRILQEIVTDDNTADYYKDKPSATLTIYLALPEQFKQIINKGKRQDSSRKDDHVYSGKVGGVSIPLMTSKD